MNTVELIDAIFRQTTVLIAELSTAAGSRAPLAHVADQVFRDLALEIERQGVRRKVVADMFGLALRSYQKKVRRLRESETHKSRTLWEVVVNYIAESGPVTRAEVFHRTRYDEESDVAAVLRDLNQSGLIHASGRGDDTLYGLNEARDLVHAERQTRLESACDHTWLCVVRNSPIAHTELAERLPYDAALLSSVLERLIRHQQIELLSGSPAKYASARCYLPVGGQHGWETAVFDHYQAVTLAIANKLKTGQKRSRIDDHVGGGTLCFDLVEGHPLEPEVLALLRDIRHRLNDVWARVEAYNDDNPIDPEALQRVWFYFGQNREGGVEEVDA